MKSLLVDAIRQASDDSPAKEQAERDDQSVDETGFDDIGDTANDERALDTGELEILESTQANLILQDEETVAEDVPDELSSTLPALRTQNMPQSTASEPPTNDAGAGRSTGLPLVGRYAPLLSSLLMAVAAGTYFLLNMLGGGYDGTDLEALPAQVGVANRQTGAETANFDLSSGHFALRVDSVPVNTPLAPEVEAAVSNRSSPAPRNAVSSNFEVRERVSDIPADPTVSDGAFPILTAAFEAHEKGDDAAAEAGYRQALTVSPLHPNALEGLAAILLRTGRPDESRVIYELLLSVDPRNSVAAAALLTVGSDDNDLARESNIKHLIQRYPDSAHLRFSLGTHYAQHSRWPDAHVAFSDAQNIDPANADYAFNLAVSLEHIGRLDEAGRYYRLALSELDSTSSLDPDVLSARVLELSHEKEGRIQ